MSAFRITAYCHELVILLRLCSHTMKRRLLLPPPPLPSPVLLLSSPPNSSPSFSPICFPQSEKAVAEGKLAEARPALEQAEAALQVKYLSTTQD